MMGKHVGRHYELVYSRPRARVDTGTLECDAIMHEWRNGDMTSPLVKKKFRERDMQIQTNGVSEVQDKISMTHCSIITR